MNEIVFYFDFLSPYAYFAQHKLVEIAKQHGRMIDYRPIDLKRAKMESGNDGPSTRAIPNKLAFANRDFERWSMRYGIPFKPVGGHDGARDLNVGALYAIAKGQAETYIARVFDHCWGRGGRPDDPDFMKGLIADLGWDFGEFADYLQSAAAEDEYERVFQLSAGDNVFGVPAVVIGSELWWGNDRLFMVNEYLEKTPSTADVSE